MTIANFGQISENPLARLALLCEWTFSTSLYFRNCNRIADIKTQWCSYGTKHKSVPDPSAGPRLFGNRNHAADHLWIPKAASRHGEPRAPKEPQPQPQCARTQQSQPQWWPQWA